MSAQSTVRDLLRERGPLTIDELNELATKQGAIVTKNPKQTIRNAVTSEPTVQLGTGDRYVYLPRFIDGACVRVPMDLASPDRGLLAITPEASALLWPEHRYRTNGKKPEIALEHGPTVVMASDHHWGGNLRTVVQLPVAFWHWWASQGDADALLLCCVDGEAGRFSGWPVNTGTLETAEVEARNAVMREAAAQAARRSRTIGLGELARRLLAREIYHHDPAPDPLAEVLLTPGSAFVRDLSGIVYRPDITPAMWRLFQHRLEMLSTSERQIILAMLALQPEDEILEGISEEEPWPEPPPLPEGAAQQGYLLKVQLKWKPGVWRTVEMRGDQTLEDLHYIIQDAFHWDDDHLYAFYLSGKRYDALTEVSAPRNFGGDEEEPPLTDEVTLAHLDLKRGQKFLYLFDFGDNLEHDIEYLGAFTPKGNVEYPRVAEAHGEAPAQYPNWEEWEE